MERREFTTSKLHKAVYDRATRQLDLHWQGDKPKVLKDLFGSLP